MLPCYQVIRLLHKVGVFDDARMLSCSLPLFDILVTDVAEFLVRQMQPIFHPLDINMMQVNHENHDKMITFIKNMMFKMTKTMTKDDEKKIII